MVCVCVSVGVIHCDEEVLCVCASCICRGV